MIRSTGARTRLSVAVVLAGLMAVGCGFQESNPPENRSGVFRLATPPSTGSTGFEYVLRGTDLLYQVPHSPQIETFENWLRTEEYEFTDGAGSERRRVSMVLPSSVSTTDLATRLGFALACELSDEPLFAGPTFLRFVFADNNEQGRRFLSGARFRQGVEYFDGRMCLAFDDGPNECSENSEDQPVSFLFGNLRRNPGGILYGDIQWSPVGGGNLSLISGSDLVLERMTSHNTMKVLVTEEGQVFEPAISHTVQFNLEYMASLLEDSGCRFG